MGNAATRDELAIKYIWTVPDWLLQAMLKEDRRGRSNYSKARSATQKNGTQFIDMDNLELADPQFTELNSVDNNDLVDADGPEAYQDSFRFGITALQALLSDSFYTTSSIRSSLFSSEHNFVAVHPFTFCYFGDYSVLATLDSRLHLMTILPSITELVYVENLIFSSDLFDLYVLMEQALPQIACAHHQRTSHSSG